LAFACALEALLDAFMALDACAEAALVLAKAFCNDLDADLAAALVAADARILLADRERDADLEREDDRERLRRLAIYIYILNKIIIFY
jgi:hypothetical protein